jgi:hypothetical protein
MHRPTHLRTLLTRSAFAIALLGVAGATGCTPSEPQVTPDLPPAPVDTAAPAGLVTATFANG